MRSMRARLDVCSKKSVDLGVPDGGFRALQCMVTGEYTQESAGARTIRQTVGKDRHSKVFTARGPRDRRVRLSVSTAIRFYDLQDRLGFEQPSKALDWLLLHCQPAINALPQLRSPPTMAMPVAPSCDPAAQPPAFHLYQARSPITAKDIIPQNRNSNDLQHLIEAATGSHSYSSPTCFDSSRTAISLLNKKRKMLASQSSPAVLDQSELHTHGKLVSDAKVSAENCAVFQCSNSSSTKQPTLERLLAAAAFYDDFSCNLCSDATRTNVNMGNNFPSLCMEETDPMKGRSLHGGIQLDSQPMRAVIGERLKAASTADSNGYRAQSQHLQFGGGDAADVIVMSSAFKGPQLEQSFIIASTSVPRDAMESYWR